MSDTLDTLQGPSSWLAKFLLPQQAQPGTQPGLKVQVNRTPPPVGPVTPGVASIPHPRPQAPAPTAPQSQAPDPLQAQLQDPETKQLLAEAMVGEGNTPQLQQAVMETIINRARISGQTIKQVIEEQGQFTSMDYNVPGGHRSRLDAEAKANDPQYQGALSLIDNPHPAWRINPSLTHFYDTRTQAAMRAKNPSIYPEKPGFAQGAPGLTIGHTQFYPGSFPTGKQQAAPPPGTAPPASSVPGQDPEITNLARQDLEAEHALIPEQIAAIEGKQKFNEQVAERITDYIGKNEEITQSLLKSNQSLIDNMPDEKKMRQEELAKVSDQPMDPTRVFGQLLPIIAMVGGAFTKAGAAGSLNAAAAAMNAAKGNDDAAIKRASDAFHDQLQETMDKWSMVHQAMTDAYTSNHDNMQDYMSAMQLVAAKYDIPALKQALISGDLKDVIGFADIGLKASLQAMALQKDVLQAENASVKLQLAQQQADVNAALTDDDLAEQAFVARRDPNYRPNFSFNVMTQNRYAHIWGMVLRHPELNSWAAIEKAEKVSGAGGTDATADTASAAIGGRAETDAGKKALTWATETKTQVQQFEDTAKQNSQLVLKYAHTAGPYPFINRWIQAGRRATGDPHIREFDAAIRTFASEYARVMTTGGTGGGGRTTNWAQQEIDHLLNDTFDTKSLVDTINVMQQEMANRMTALDRTIATSQERVNTGKEPGTSSAKTPPGFKIINVQP